MNVLEVRLEMKGCVVCETRGVPGDDWRETGFFVFGENLVIHIPLLVRVRRSVLNGTPITTAWDAILASLYRDLRWMRRNVALAKRQVRLWLFVARPVWSASLVFFARATRPDATQKLDGLIL